MFSYGGRYGRDTLVDNTARTNSAVAKEVEPARQEAYLSDNL